MFSTIFFAWLYHLALYVDNGCFAFAWIALALALVSEGSALSCIALGFIDPLFALKIDIKYLEGMKTMLVGKTALIAQIALVVPLAIVLCVFSVEDDEVYNNLVAAFLLVASAASIALMMTTRWFTFKLGQELTLILKHSPVTSSSSTESSQSSLRLLQERLQQLNKGLTIAVIDVLGFILPIPVVFYVLGSLPFAWIISPVLAYAGCLCIAIYIIQFLRIKKRTVNDGEITSGTAAIMGKLSGG